MEFIKENKKVRKQELDQESDQENKNNKDSIKKTRKKTRTRPRKKEKLSFFLHLSLRRLFYEDLHLLSYDFFHSNELEHES